MIYIINEYRTNYLNHFFFRISHSFENNPVQLRINRKLNAKYLYVNEHKRAE